MSLVMPPSVIPAHADEGPVTVYPMRSCPPSVSPAHADEGPATVYPMKSYLPPSFLRKQTKAPRPSTP